MKRFQKKYFNNETNCQILIEVDDLTTKLLENENVDIQKEMELAVANIINQMMFGYRFAGEKMKEFNYLMDILQRQQKLGGGLKSFALIYKWTRKLPGLKQHYQKSVRRNLNNMKRMV